MNTYETLEQAAGKSAKLLSSSEYEFNGQTRLEIKLYNSRSKRACTVIRYESGRYSEKVVHTAICTKILLEKLETSATIN